MVKLSVYIREAIESARCAAAAAVRTVATGPVPESMRMLRESGAQGTTEYAILVGVLVVIAILAIVAFRDSLTNLWDAIKNGINSL